MWFGGIWLFAYDIIVIDWRVYHDIVLHWSERHQNLRDLEKKKDYAECKECGSSKVTMKIW